jgi:hypothetical protein
MKIRNVPGRFFFGVKKAAVLEAQGEGFPPFMLFGSFGELG